MLTPFVLSCRRILPAGIHRYFRGNLSGEIAPWIGLKLRMIAKLQRTIDDLHALQSKLLLVVGPPGAGKTKLLEVLGKSREAEIMNVGAALGRRLTTLPPKERPLQVNTIFRELAEKYASGDLLLIDNIELLFDLTLRLDPLDLLKRQARRRRVIAVWPGELREGRLTYAVVGHPEYRDYGLEGLVPFEIQSQGNASTPCVTAI